MKSRIAIPLTFLALLIIGSSMIYFGSRNDAVSVAKSLKSGVLTADEVNVAFQNVGGKLIKQHVQESQFVKKGDVLLTLDDVDMNIAIERLKAVVIAQKSQVRQEELAIQIEESELNLLEITTWRKVEELQAGIEAVIAAQELAKVDYNRALKLRKTNSVSQSAVDNARNTLTQANMQVLQIKSQLLSATVGATQAQIAKLAKDKDATGMTINAIIHAREKNNNRQNQLAQWQAKLVQSEADLKQLELDRSRLTLIAPEDGKILKLIYEEGEIVPINAPAVLLETHRKYVDIYVNENMVKAYLPETKITASVPALDANIDGIVRFATAAPSFADLRMTRERGQADLTSYQVRIYMDDHPQLLTGMTVEVDDAQQH